MSSFTLPVRTGASPTTFRIAAVSIAGVASSGRSVTIGIVPATVTLPARLRNCRRVVGMNLVPKRCKKGDDVLDLSGRQDRLAGEIAPDAHEAIVAVIGGHDG